MILLLEKQNQNRSVIIFRDFDYSIFYLPVFEPCTMYCAKKFNNVFYPLLHKFQFPSFLFSVIAPWYLYVDKNCV